MATLARSSSRHRAARRLSRLLVALTLFGAALGAAGWSFVPDTRPVAIVPPTATTPLNEQATLRADEGATPRAEARTGEQAEARADASAPRSPAWADRPRMVGVAVVAATTARVGTRAVPAVAGPRAPPSPGT